MVSLSLPEIELAEHVVDAGHAPENPWRCSARAGLVLMTRLAIGCFLLLTSIYFVLFWVPFSYFGFIRDPLVSWLPLFVHWHGPIYTALVLGVAATLVPDLRRSESRGATIGFLALNGGAAIYFSIVGALAKIEPDLRVYIRSMLGLFPLAWLAALDLSLTGHSWCKGYRRLNLAQTTIAAVLVSCAFAVCSAFHGAGKTIAFTLRAFTASLCFHLIIFTAIGLILAALSWLTNKTSRPVLWYRLSAYTFGWFVLVLVLRTMIFPTISFEGALANIFAVVVSGVIVLFYAASIQRVRATSHYEMLPVQRSWWIWGIAIIALLVAVYGIPALLARTDWDFVLQRSAVLLVWLLVLQAVRWTKLGFRQGKLSAVLLVVVAGAFLAFARYAKLALYNPSPAPEWQGVFDEFAGADISFKTAYDLLSRPVDNQEYRQFYEFLKQNTNIARSENPAPADLRLVANLQATPGAKPNVFIFVIDSWRQDMASAYNPAVDYTPEIARFARESFVFKNAFTRYGGTALSEPAIWTGTMQLHKQYIEPFYPMNNLQKLLETGSYHSYISVDPIIRNMLGPSSSITELETGSGSWSDLDFVPTLKELEAKIDARSDSGKPIFAYTQPQNVHTITLARSKIKGGREAASIFELRRMDAAFGEFVEFLRRHHLYDNSIIILTADHGDAYGEYGRWGHSDFLFPEVIRIPLIVHLPPRMQQEFVSDQNQLAFTTDITPSLYYLLGHRPILNNQLLGRPLFTQSPGEQVAYRRPQYLIVSSYAPVYAELSGDGRSLFIADAVHSRSYFYNLKDDPAGAHNHVTISLENEYAALIRHDVRTIDQAYGWHPAETQ